MAFLSLDQVHKRFGDTAVLNGVSLEVERGETLVLLGPSGSGKTTLLRLIAGFETADAGSMLLDGVDFTTLPPAKRHFGVVFQHYALFPHLSVAENIAFGLDQKLSAAALAVRVEEALEQVALGGFGERRVHEISGGQQQRVAVARALAPGPRVLLLDEPLSNLDPNLREGTRRELRRTLDVLDITAIWVTHEQEEAFDVADRVALLGRGVLEQAGAPADLYASPRSLFVASFVGKVSSMAGELVEDGVAVVRGSGEVVVWPATRAEGVSPGDRVALSARPESLEFVDQPSATSLEGEVTERRYGGAATYVRVRLESQDELEVAVAATAPEIGQRVRVDLRADGGVAWAFPRQVYGMDPDTAHLGGADRTGGS